jgi:integrase
LYLDDSRVGPIIVILSSPARAVIDALEVRDPEWMFPAMKTDGPITYINDFWQPVKKEAKLADDFTAKDFRHNYTQIGRQIGVSEPIIAKLLNQHPATTLSHTDYNDKDMHEAAAKISAFLERSDPDKPEDDT